MDDISTTEASHIAETSMAEVIESDGLAAENAQEETGQSAQDSVTADADTSTTAAATSKASGRGGRGGGRGGRGGGAKGAGRGGAKAAAAAAGGAKGKAAKESGGGGGGGAGGANPTFPLARVARIVKADRDIETTSKDAIWIIAVATELFIKHLTDSAIAKARLEKKKIVTYKELASAVDTQPEFSFLSDVVPQSMPLEQAFGLRQELDEENRARAVGLIIDELSEDEVEEEEAVEEGGEAGKEGGEPAQLADAALDEESAAAVPTKKASTAANGKPKGKKYGKAQRATNESEDNGGDVSTSTKKAGGKAKKGRPTAEPAEDAEMVDA